MVEVGKVTVGGPKMWIQGDRLTVGTEGVRKVAIPLITHAEGVVSDERL